MSRGRLGGGGGGGGQNLRLGTSLHTLQLSPQNTFGDLHNLDTIRRNALRELFIHLMPSGLICSSRF